MALKLEVFEAGPPEPSSTSDTSRDSELEDARLAAFEKGYSAGWDDAIATERDGQNRLRADLAHQLQEMAFTYHEARANVVRSLEPLLAAMTNALLPAVARQALGPIVAEVAETLARQATDVPLTIRVASSDLGVVEEFIGAQNSLRLVADDSLSQGQVWIGSAKEEAEIDITAATRTICDALDGYFKTEPELRKHG